MCLAATHTYADNGAFDVTIAVTDKDGGIGTRMSSIVVNNVTPTLTSVANNGPVDEGGTTTITADASDVAGAADPLTYGFDCRNDGYWEIYSQAGNTAECTFQDNGEYEAQVRVSDGDGGWAFGSTTVVVNNALPVVDQIERVTGIAAHRRREGQRQRQLHRRRRAGLPGDEHDGRR